MKFKYLLFFIVCLSLMPLAACAECSDSRKAELNKIASNVKFSYYYQLNEDGVPKFNIVISNITSDIYVVDNYGNQYRNFENVVTADSTEFQIYSNDINCNEIILTRNITLPSYNKFSKLEECKDNSSKLCNIWYDTDYYYENDFINELKKEKKVKQNYVVKDDIQKKDNTIIFLVVGFTFFVLVVLALIVLLIKKKR